MRYNQPDVKTEQTDTPETDEPVYWEGRPRYVSDQTAFMRWSTEMEPTDSLIDKEFMNRNQHRVIDINKFLPLSFIEKPESIKLFRLRRINMTLCQEAGLTDLADETVLDNLADYQTTRGVKGNYQNALITQKREWRSHSPPKKRGMFDRLVRGRQMEYEAEDIVAGE